MLGCGIIERGSRHGAYKLTLAVAAIGAAALADRRPGDEVHRVLRSVRSDLDETVGLVQRDGESGLVVDRALSSLALSYNIRVGTRLPIHASAAGKVLLAKLSDEEVSELLSKTNLRALTVRTITDIRKLLRELQTVRSQGFAFDFEEYALGLHCVAVEVSHPFSETAYALGISGPMGRLPKPAMKSAIDRLKEAAHEIERTLSLLARDNDPFVTR
jgi:IclR family acetate operon transcriptional repressor